MTLAAGNSHRRSVICALAWVALLVGCSHTPATLTDQDVPGSLRHQRLLFVGAHPDDEWVLMPVFVEACVFHGATCHFVSATRGEWGCFETLGLPDLDACAGIREREFRRSAAIAHGSAEVLDWEDLFYAHSGGGVRRNLTRWSQREGGREHLVEALVSLLQRFDPDVVFGLDPRHGATCHPSHRAVSLILIDAVRRLPAIQRPRVLFENAFAVQERMTPEMLNASARGAMFPWPTGSAGTLYYDGNRSLPNGRRGIEYQVDALRAHASQFPELPAEIRIDADASALRIPLADLADIDPAEELCTALDLGDYRTVDKSLAHVFRRIEALAAAAPPGIAVHLVQGGATVLQVGLLDSTGHQSRMGFGLRDVQLVVGAASREEADAALDAIERIVSRYVNAPP